MYPLSNTVQYAACDFIPLPAKSLHHRGAEISRATLIRAAKRGLIKTRLFRQPGSTQGRRYILRESLDAYIEACMMDIPIQEGTDQFI